MILTCRSLFGVNLQLIYHQVDLLGMGTIPGTIPGIALGLLGSGTIPLPTGIIPLGIIPLPGIIGIGVGIIPIGIFGAIFTALGGPTTSMVTTASPLSRIIPKTLLSMDSPPLGFGKRRYSSVSPKTRFI